MCPCEMPIKNVGADGRPPLQDSFFSFNRFSHFLQNSLGIAFRQFIEQPQHGLDHARVWRNVARLAEGFDGLLIMDRGRLIDHRPSSIVLPLLPMDNIFKSRPSALLWWCG